MKVYSFQLSHAPVTNLDVGLSTHTIEDSLKDFYCDLSPSEIFEPLVMKVNDEMTLKDTPKFNSSSFLKLEQDNDKKRVLLAQSGPSIFSKIFSGLYKLSSKCEVHMKSKPKITYFTQIILELEIEERLGTSLRKYFGHEQENKYCQICKKETPHSVKITADILPPVLVVQVPRFENGIKNDDIMNYPMTIDFLGEFCEKTEQPRYDLMGVITNQSNSLKDSHYTTMIQRKSGEILQFDPKSETSKIIGKK
jgi:ubiquitin C-terminal hydrolase